MTLAQGREAPEPSATGLSWQSARRRKIAGVSHLARLSLLGGWAMLFVPSCIVADPPEYQEPVQTRPVLDVFQAVPTTLRVLVVYTNDQVPFAVPVRSEDAGEDLFSQFFLDYTVVTPSFSLNSQTIPASTYADDGRTVSFNWTVNVSTSGCHLMSLVVAHRSSFLNTDATILDPKKKDTDAAIINWWLNVNPLAGDLPSTLVGCPIGGISTTTTGVPSK